MADLGPAGMQFLSTPNPGRFLPLFFSVSSRFVVPAIQAVEPGFSHTDEEGHYRSVELAVALPKVKLATKVTDPVKPSQPPQLLPERTSPGIAPEAIQVS